MKRTIIGLLFLLPVLAFIPVQRKTKILMAGDSTMSIKRVSAYPETGWGMPFAYFWDSTIEVVNLAQNGRSTKSFINEGLWDKLIGQAALGDYVFIQFGHNDEVPTKKNATTEDEFRGNLQRFVDESIAKGAVPILLTPVARRKFNDEGKVAGTHDVYAQIVRDVALEKNVVMIDLDKKAQKLYEDMGVENSKLLFNYLQPGEHPNYPEGNKDDTHFNELGARKVAEMVWEDIEVKLPDLAKRTLKKSK